MLEQLQTATFAGGCFWCIEAVFKRLKGVTSVKSGYEGSGKPNPTYEEVSGGHTGYAEAVQIEFDPSVISYQKLLDVFWAVHEPTTLNKQGNDVGTQYRSAIFYHNDEQKAEAENSKSAAQSKFPDPIVTAIESQSNFYPAEKYHDDYYDQNRNQPYCRFVIDPKIQKLYKDFAQDLKEE
jgi:peptide-methionine (S)-S-oxide reductase